jgi:hypothetical protein
MASLAVAALAFGATIAAIKGQDVGFRDALGNMSAPWVLVRSSRAREPTVFGAARSSALP